MVQADNNYFIKNEYVHGSINNTSDKISGENYWTDSKLFESSQYQFQVYKKALELLRNNCDPKPLTILDIGCGTAEKLKFIHNLYPMNNYIGIDQNNIIEILQYKYPWGRWVADDLESGIKTQIKADLIICSDVIEHLLEPLPQTPQHRSSAI